MKIIYQICLEDQIFEEGKRIQRLKRGQEYVTSIPKDGLVTVFTSPHWVRDVDATKFGGARS